MAFARRLVLAVHFGCALASLALQTTFAAEPIPLKSENGTLVLPILINDKITLGFVLDSGAADVSIPADVFSTLRRTGTLSETDLLSPATYVLADGSVRQQVRFRIRSLKVGGFELRNVVGSVAPAQGELLLGQSFLRRLRSWSIDNQRRVLIINGTVADTAPSESPPRVSAASKPPHRASAAVKPAESATFFTPHSCSAAQSLCREDSPLCETYKREFKSADYVCRGVYEHEWGRWERCTPAQLRAGECN